MAAYLVTLETVADLSRGYDPDLWRPAWRDWDSNWRKIARIEHAVPPSWLLADELIRPGAGGLLFPSLRHPGGTKLVIFNATLTDADRVQVHDPDHLLPRDQRSWGTSA